MAEKLIYPLKNMRITQHYNGKNNHYKHSTGVPKDYPIDDGERDTGGSIFYAPCEIKVSRIYGVGGSGVNTLWLTSTKKVETACGTVDYVTIMIEHCTDSSLRKLKVGQVFKAKQPICEEGSDQASGNHFHISVGKGKISGNGWVKNNKGAYVLATTGGAWYPQSAFFVDDTFTKIIDSDGINFKRISNIITEERDDNYMAKTWKNGKTKELVYQTVSDCKSKKNSVGSLGAYEAATCVAEIDNCYLVVYNSSSTKKCGFVEYAGGIK